MRSIHSGDARRTSDAEITRPQNDLPSEPPLLPAWHVHLELQPEELLTLHRLGFTGGALAWREGMPEWQPLRVGEGGPDDPQDAVAAEEGVPRPIPLTRRSGSGASATVTPLNGARRNSAFASKRPSTPPLANPVAVAPKLERRRPELLPPPPPPPIELLPDPPRQPRALALAEPRSKREQSRSPVSLVREQLPASIPPPVAIEVRPRPQRSVGTKALWLGAAALVALSASNGALVSALLWSLRHDASQTAAASAGPTGVAKSGASAAQAEECAAPNDNAATRVGARSGSAAATPVSVDQLPLMGASKRASTAGSESQASEPTRALASTASGARSRRSARVVLAEEPRRAAGGSATPTGSGGPLDRKALARAVARAASGATSCGAGPEKGRVSLTFAPSGSVQGVQLIKSFGEPGINSCVLRAMGRARVAAFSGDAVTVHKTLSW